MCGKLESSDSARCLGMREFVLRKGGSFGEGSLEAAVAGDQSGLSLTCQRLISVVFSKNVTEIKRSYTSVEYSNRIRGLILLEAEDRQLRGPKVQSNSGKE